MPKKEQRTGLTETAVDTTVNIHKLAHRATFKRKAPTAIKKVKQLVQKMMKTEDVRIDPKLNQFVWAQGVRNLPHKVRVRISRKRNEEEGNSKGEFYSLVQHVHIEDFAGRLTEKSKVSA